MQTKATTSTHLIFKSLSRHFLGTLWIWTKSNFQLFFSCGPGLSEKVSRRAILDRWKYFDMSDNLFVLLTILILDRKKLKHFQIFYQVLLIILIRNQLINLELDSTKCQFFWRKIRLAFKWIQCNFIWFLHLYYLINSDSNFHRSREVAADPLAEEEPDVWYSTSKLFMDHINEVSYHQRHEVLSS